MSTFIVVGLMLAIMLVSLLWGGDGGLRNDPHSAAAWAILLIGATIAEFYLIFVRDHTLSQQMQFWIHGNETITGLIMFAFWVWLTVHFVVEPIVTVASRLLK